MAGENRKQIQMIYSLCMTKQKQKINFNEELEHDAYML